MGAVPPAAMEDEIDQGSWWPYTEAPEKRHGEGGWTLSMNAGGSMCLFPSEATPPQGFLHVYEAGRKELERFLVMFCARGYENDERLVHQDGRVWLFNWRSFTLAQLFIASQVADLFCAGDVDGAWAVGRAFGDQIDAAVGDYYARREQQAEQEAEQQQ